MGRLTELKVKRAIDGIASGADRHRVRSRAAIVTEHWLDLARMRRGT
jgi:hypothetical protein